MSRLQQIAKLREELAAQRRELVQQVTAMREKTVATLPDMVARAKETLEGKLAKVYLAQDTAEAVRILGQLLEQDSDSFFRLSNDSIIYIGPSIKQG